MSKVIKLLNGFTVHHGFSHSMEYDKDGKYRGQWQPNVYDYGDIFISPEIIDGVPCVNGEPVAPLTPEEMAAAARLSQEGE